MGQSCYYYQFHCGQTFALAFSCNSSLILRFFRHPSSQAGKYYSILFANVISAGFRRTAKFKHFLFPQLPDMALDCADGCAGRCGDSVRPASGVQPDIFENFYSDIYSDIYSGIRRFHRCQAFVILCNSSLIFRFFYSSSQFWENVIKYSRMKNVIKH